MSGYRRALLSKKAKNAGFKGIISGAGVAVSVGAIGAPSLVFTTDDQCVASYIQASSGQGLGKYAVVNNFNNASSLSLTNYDFENNAATPNEGNGTKIDNLTTTRAVIAYYDQPNTQPTYADIQNLDATPSVAAKNNFDGGGVYPNGVAISSTTFMGLYAPTSQMRARPYLVGTGVGTSDHESHTSSVGDLFSSAFLDTNKCTVTYPDPDATSNLVCERVTNASNVASIGGNTITITSSLKAVNSTGYNTCYLSPTAQLAFYLDSSNDSQIRIISYNGTSISLGTEFEVMSSTIINRLQIQRRSDTSAVVIYERGSVKYSRLITGIGTTNTVGPEINLSLGASTITFAMNPSGTRGALLYNNTLYRMI